MFCFILVLKICTINNCIGFWFIEIRPKLLHSVESIILCELLYVFNCSMTKFSRAIYYLDLFRVEPHNAAFLYMEARQNKLIVLFCSMYRNEFSSLFSSDCFCLFGGCGFLEFENLEKKSPQFQK